MALIGGIEVFNENTTDFETYLERIEHLFEVNAVEPEKKVSLFITLAGPQVYNTLKNLVAPKKPGQCTYAEVTKLLSGHYSPTVSEIHERFVFNKCNQKTEQSVADYIAELRKLASTCNFNTFLDEALRDRFVCGIRSENIQRKLLSISNLTFVKACQEAQAAELAEKQVRVMSDGGLSSSRVGWVCEKSEKENQD